MHAQPFWQLNGSTSARPAAGRLDAVAGRMLAALMQWQERGRQRRALALLDDARLRDLGLSRAAAAQECAKPVWRA